MPLRKNTPMSTYIKDFEKSDAPQFKGKSKEKRREMAIAAKLQASGKKKMDEMDSNDPILMKLRAAAHKRSLPKPEPSEPFKADKNADKIKKLEQDRVDLMFKIEKTAELEGGPIADSYADELVRIDTEIAKLKKGTVTEKKGTLCGRCGHVHVKGTPCPRPFKETKMTSKYDDAPELKGKQTELPDNLQKSIIDKMKKKLKEIDSDKTRGTVTIKKATPPAEIKKLTDQGVDVELVPESLDFFERTLDDDTYVDVSGPSVEMTMEELLGDFAERLKDIPEADRKDALNAIKTFWIRMIREWNPNLIVPGRATVTESKKSLTENHQYDFEGKMAKAQLISIIKNAKSLYDSIDDRTQLKSWVQSKLSKAEDYIDGVRTYLDGEAVSSTAPLMHNGELVHDDEGAMLKIGDVVKGADGRIYQAAYSYSDAKPFLTPFDLKNRKPVNLRERHYFDTVNEGDMSPTKKMVKVMEYSATRGGFVR